MRTWMLANGEDFSLVAARTELARLGLILLTVNIVFTGDE